MNWRHVVSITGGLVVLLTAGRAASQAAPFQQEYHASWIALASPEPVNAEVESKSWARLVTFRPERAFVLTAPLTEAGKSRQRLDAGAVMVGMKAAPGIACRLERPTHVYPVALGDLSAEQLPALDMVLLYSGRSVISAATGAHTFQLCILKPGVRNLWGDKTVGRGCLPDVVVKDGDFPMLLQIYGRTLTIATPVDGRVSVSVMAYPEELPVAL